MRKTTTTLTNPIRTYTIGYPDSVAFMYSPQIVWVQVAAAGALSGDVSVTVAHRGTGKNHTESRALYDNSAHFDLRRILQLLAPDVDTLPQRLDAGDVPAETFAIVVRHDGTTLFSTTLRVMYGALDQGEIYGEHTQRRLWLNYPQTFNLWQNSRGEFAFLTDDALFEPDILVAPTAQEVDFLQVVKASGDTELLERLRAGVPLRNVGLTWASRIEAGAETPQDYRLITLVPDCSSKGTYLRWINRRGELSYWLFTNSQLRVTAATDATFSRYYEGDPATPQDGAYRNSQKADYREARELVLGAVGLSRDEFDDLCDLFVSPVVERLMLPVPEEDTEVGMVFDGGDASADSDIAIQGADAADTTLNGGDASTLYRDMPIQWQRVTVAAGSYSRNIKRNTPSLQDIELIIELPERNTIKL